MPVEAEASVWRALLNACQLHSATKLAGTIYMLEGKNMKFLCLSLIIVSVIVGREEHEIF
ncbi:unnamed protein product [Prunus armeniaca]